MSDTNGALADEGPLPETEQVLEEMWTGAVQEISRINPQTENWKIQTLPLARIKKIMKSEEFILQELEKDRLRDQGLDIDSPDKTGVKFMISSEAPLVMSKACELLVKEITNRAWQHTERNRRRTLQRQDVLAAVGESEVFDFLIDIVPRVAVTRVPGTQPPGDAHQPPNLPPLQPPNDPNYLAPQQHAGNFEGMQETQNPAFNAQMFQYMQGGQNDQGNVSQASQQPAQPWNDHAAM